MEEGEFDNDTLHEPQEMGVDIANDIAQFEKRSKQKSSVVPAAVTAASQKPKHEVEEIKDKPSHDNNKPKQTIVHKPKPEPIAEEDEKERMDADRAELKNQVLCDQLYKKTEELKKAKKMVQVIENTKDADAKDKKLIELAKLNRSLKLKLEGIKTQ